MRWLIVLLMVAAMASAQLIDVHFGDTQVDNLTADSVTTLNDSVHVAGIVIGDGSHLTFYDAALDAYLQFTASSNSAEFYNDVVVDSQLTVGDTLAVGLSTPEHFFHVANDGVYNLFEGNDDGKTYVAVDNNHATHECGYSIWRQGTEMWTVEDSNGLFIIYDSDGTANRLSIDGTTGNVVIYQNLSVSNDFFVTDSVGIGGDVFVTGNFISDMVAPTYNFASASEVSGSGDSIVINFAYDIPALTPGLTIEFIAESSNSGATKIYLDGGAGKDVYEASDISALEANDIRSGMFVIVKYDNTQWQQVSQSGN